jgi:anti-sigma B factor antagonist
MEFYYHDVDQDVLILSADGGLVSDTAEQFVEELGRFVELGCRKLVVDCTRLNYISSYGMGLLVRLHKKLASKGGDVKLAAVAGAVPRVLSMARLNEVFQIFPTVEDARRAFGERPGGVE